MKITITKKEHRNRLACERADGTSVTADLGPGLPHHDLAHYVVEKQLGLKGGFFGNIAHGYSIAQLSDKDVIKSLGAESWIAEILARALQSLSSGACTTAQFPELVNLELANLSIADLNKLDAGTIERMYLEFRVLLERYRLLKNGEALEFEFAEGEPERA